MSESGYEYRIHEQDTDYVNNQALRFESLADLGAWLSDQNTPTFSELTIERRKVEDWQEVDQ